MTMFELKLHNARIPETMSAMGVDRRVFYETFDMKIGPAHSRSISYLQNDFR